MKKKTVLAFDLGASSGRAMLCGFDGERITLKEAYRFVNAPIQQDGALRWDAEAFKAHLERGLAAAAHDAPASFGIDTWGVDFGLLDGEGALTTNPLHYRDSITDGIMDKAFEVMPQSELYRRTGLAFLQFNTLYQLYALSLRGDPALRRAKTLLLMPDLLGYLLTGARGTEYTIASTTQLIDARAREWAWDIIDAFALPHIFTDINSAPAERGILLPDIAERAGVGRIPLISVAGHDTASAVAAVPSAPGSRTAYISSGTWSLVGVSLNAPHITDGGMAANLTNEGGVFGTTRTLKNVMGMWIIQELKREWEKEGGAPIPFDRIEAEARQAAPFTAFIDPDDPVFLPPGGMGERIRTWLARTNQPLPGTMGAMARLVYESLAMKYRWTLDALKEAAGTLDALHIVGGGVRNAMLNAFTADACGIPVHTGPVEATAAGNALMQLCALGELGGEQEMKEVVRASFEVETVEPKDTAAWEDVYARFLKVAGL